MQTTTIAAKMPKVRTGIIGDKPRQRNARAVVSDVLNTVSMVREKAYKSRRSVVSSASSTLGTSACAWRHASNRTKLSSAPIPRARKILQRCNEPKYSILNTMRYTNADTGIDNWICASAASVKAFERV